MTKKTWIVWALFLLLPGVVGLSIQFAQTKALQNRISRASQQIAQSVAAQEYLQMYEQWSDLPADQKADNPWGCNAYGGGEILDRLKESQRDRLLADLPTLEKGLMHYPEELGDVMYGLEWQQEVDRYRTERATAEVVLIGSTFLLAGGGLVLAGGGIKLLALFIIKKRSNGDDVSALQTADANEKATDNASQENSSSLNDSSKNGVASLNETSRRDEQKDNTSEHRSKGYFQSHTKETQDHSSKPGDLHFTELPMKPVMPEPKSSAKTQKDSYFGWAIEPECPEDLEALMTTEPLTKELTELTEEVSAIRQFAAQQQDQMRKLQDGYDWMIIRRFSLRIIRCIDNIDDRITHLEARGEDVSVHLEDIRDELIFAMESSGIEQFKPDLKTTFKGLEKYAETVQERHFTEDANLTGCIAEVTRPGYQYLVNDNDVKIVRCAQVKLYETKQS